HNQTATVQLLGNHSAHLNALYLASRRRSAAGVFPDQRGQWLLIRARSLLQESVEVKKPVFVAVPKSECPHAVHMLVHDRAQMATIWRQWAKCLKCAGWLITRQYPQHRGRGAAVIPVPQFHDRVDRNSSMSG